MTCKHVLGLIDAGPFAGYPASHVAAARQHARQCPACGAALEASENLVRDLAALPQPPAPRGFAPAVLARIARIEEAAGGPVAAARQQTPSFGLRILSPSATAIGGLGAILSVVLSMLRLGGGVAVDVSPSVAGTLGGLADVPMTTTWLAVFAASLSVYVVGLFSRS